MIGIMLAQHRGQWLSITSALSQCMVLSCVSGAEIESVTRIGQKHGTITQCCFNVGPAPKTVDQQ